MDKKSKRITSLVEMCNELHSKFSQKLAMKMLKEITDMDNELHELENLTKHNNDFKKVCKFFDNGICTNCEDEIDYSPCDVIPQSSCEIYKPIQKS